MPEEEPNILQQSIYALVDDVLAFQETEEGKKQKASMSPESFRKECQTVRVCSRRRSGHTTAALSIIRSYRQQILIILPVQSMIRHFKSHADSDNTIVVGVKEILDNDSKYRGIHFDFIIFDCNSLINKFDSDLIIKRFGYCAKLVLHLE